jgi:hypothetical protein
MQATQDRELDELLADDFLTSEGLSASSKFMYAGLHHLLNPVIVRHHRCSLLDAASDALFVLLTAVGTTSHPPTLARSRRSLAALREAGIAVSGCAA